MKTWQYIGLGLVGIFAILQLFPIDKTNPTAIPEKDLFAVVDAPVNVKSVIKSACYDCHSYETTYPWYTNLQPFAWSIKDHINHGRKHLNFSEFADYTGEDRSHALEECVEVLQEDEMPIASYKLMHPEARLNDETRQTLITWFQQLRGNGSAH
ncbi:MAG: heme-binding domain-containing protein [Saprospiraceae bacterium]|nr:heme-binding domain-containing protein [Saprospiraceae bacterium]